MKKKRQKPPRKSASKPRRPSSRRSSRDRSLAAAATANLPETEARLVELLTGYGKKAPVSLDFTTVDEATWDYDVLIQDINARWNFAAGQAYVSKTQITRTWPVYNLAVDIDQRGGIWHP